MLPSLKEIKDNFQPEYMSFLKKKINSNKNDLITKGYISIEENFGAFFNGYTDPKKWKEVALYLDKINSEYKISVYCEMIGFSICYRIFIFDRSRFKPDILGYASYRTQVC
jgi:hypothetical protein